MRVSCKLLDTDFWFLHFDKRPMVLLDGVELKRVMEADDQQGYATVYDSDAQGQLKLATDRVIQKNLRGKVEIVGRRSEKGII